MFARFTRIPLRRCIHTHAARPQHARFARAALSASLVTASYLAWRSFSDPIALDSPTVQPHRTSPKSLQKTSLPTSEDKPDIPSIPDAESLSDPASSPKSSLGDPQPSSKSLSKPSEDKANEEGSDSQGERAEGEGQTSGGAFNPETGEINWDCPCLGGMAHGPCGPEFREAFSCFVYSEQEPKGIDCVEKFKAMQDCFRRHPEVYSDELMEDDEETEGAPAPESAATAPKSEEEAILIESTSTSESLVPTPPSSSPSVKST